MNKWLALLLYLLSVHSAVAEDTELKASIEISVQQETTNWAGQQLTLNLDLKTTGFSFADVYFNLPEVRGAFLMQIDTTTVKSTKNIDGQAWQIISYPLALYPQAAGLMEIPPISVRFNTSAGFGKEEKSFSFETPTLQLEITSPPGIKAGDLVITTSSFNLEYQWQPETDISRTGDALTLSITRKAADISAMLFPPLPVFHTAGLAAYPQAPVVIDKSNRGDLVGERTDKIIWLVEEAGEYQIPDISFQWWDPGSQELKQQIVTGRKINIAATVTVSSSDKISQQSWLMVGIIIALLALLWWLFRHKTHLFTNRKQQNTEKQAFKHLQKTSKLNSPKQTHVALYSWLEFFPELRAPNSSGFSLKDFADTMSNQKLAKQLNYLQESLISADENWRSGELMRVLRSCRHRLLQEKLVQSKQHLSPLNP